MLAKAFIETQFEVVPAPLWADLLFLAVIVIAILLVVLLLVRKRKTR